ncbi:MAG: efflux RND transporter periplasmic adaptor subunit [Verrucomicrobiota bacterium]
MQPFSFFKNAIIIVAAIVLLVSGVLAIKSFNRPVAEVSPARIGRAIAAVYGTVKIEWLYTVNVKAMNSGYIHFAPGIFAGQTSIGYVVKKGQLLGTIFDEATSRQIRQAKVDLQAATDRARLGPMSTQSLKTARDNFERIKKLRELNNIPAAQFEQAQNDIQRLENQVKAEQIELNRLVETLTQNVKNLQEKLGKSEIRSPIDGILTGVNYVDGELVLENNAVFTLAMSGTYVMGQVNEEDVGSLKPGMKAKIKLYSFGGREFNATLTSILPSGDTSTNRYSVVLNMEDAPDNLMAGMTGEMNIILGEKENSLLIPARALIGDRDRVLIVEDDQVTPRRVKLGYQTLEIVEIIEGLKEGDRVIVSDQDLFYPGERVRPLTEDAERDL